MRRDASGDMNGYWFVTEKGSIYSFDAAPFLGSRGGNNGGSTVEDIASSWDGHSYAWVHANGEIEMMSAPADVTITTNGRAWTALPESGALVTLTAPDGNAATQQWQLWKATNRDNSVQIYNRATGTCLTMGEDAMFAELDPCKSETEGRDDQLFDVTSDKDGSTFIQLHNHPESSIQPVPLAGQPYLFMPEAEAYPWTVEPVGKNLNITSQVSGQVIGAREGDQQLHTEASASSVDQHWTLRPAGRNTFQIVNTRTGECMQVPGDHLDLPLYSGSCYTIAGTNTNQSWQVRTSGNGTEFVPAEHPDYRISLNSRSNAVELVKYDPRHKDPSTLWTVSAQTDSEQGQSRNR